MGMDPIDDALQKAEGVPGLGGFVRDLRFAWEVWRKPPADPGPLQNQANLLADLQHTTDQLATEFSDSMLALQQTWAGTEADAYIGQIPTMFEVEHDMAPPNNGAGYAMWDRLSMTRDLLDYNAAAHRQGVENIGKLRDLHDTLDFNIKLAAVDLAAMVVTAFIPVADLIGDPIEAVVEAREVAVCVTAARSVQTLESVWEGYDVVAEATKIAATAARTAQVLSTIQKVRMIAVGVEAVIEISAIGTIVYSVSTFSQEDFNKLAPPQDSTTKGNKLPPLLEPPYPPNIKTDEQKATYNFLLMNYGYEVANQYALSLIIPYGVDLAALQRFYGIMQRWRSVPPLDIAVLMKAGLTDAQIDNLIQHYRWAGNNQLDTLIQRPDAVYIVQELAKYVQAPYFTLFGIDQVVADLVNNSRTSYNGAVYQLQVMAHFSPDQISHVEPNVPTVGSPGTTRGPDIVLKSGVVIQCKSYNWCAYRDPTLLNRMVNSLQKNITDDEARYPGRVEYYFNSSPACPMPTDVQNLLNNNNIPYHNWP
ncbi:MAG: hypothetical protein H0X24_02230 [Ktedonobacterales bacterium]|nr:hypothetical protein [Ktedonobacterales bacterium]